MITLCRVIRMGGIFGYVQFIHFVCPFFVRLRVEGSNALPEPGRDYRLNFNYRF